MTTHEGHRQRLRRRFLLEGLDNFDEVQVLELLLFYAIPRRDTNPIAHALLEQFGSLSGVLEAPVSALAQVPGMGENGATLLQLVTAASRRWASPGSIRTRQIRQGSRGWPRKAAAQQKLGWSTMCDFPPLPQVRMGKSA